MAFSISAFGDAIKQGNIKEKIVLYDDAISEFEQIALVSNQLELDFLESDAAFSAQAIGWGPDSSDSNTISGSTRTVSVVDVESEIQLYKKTLEKKWTGYAMNPMKGAGLDPYAALIQNTIVETLAKKWRKDIWVGTNTTSSCNGIVTQLTASTTRVVDTDYSGTTGYASITYANIDTVVDSMISNIPDDLSDRTDLKLYMSRAHQRLLFRKLRDTNSQYVYAKLEGESNNRLMYNGEVPVEIVGVDGLVDTNYMICGPAGRIAVGFNTNTLSEEIQSEYNFARDAYLMRISLSYVPGFYNAAEFVCNF